MFLLKASRRWAPALMLPATIRALCAQPRWSALILYRTAEGWGVLPQAGPGRWSKQNREPLYPHSRLTLCACLTLTNIWQPVYETLTHIHAHSCPATVSVARKYVAEENTRRPI